jgi:hypothetical protein
VTRFATCSPEQDRSGAAIGGAGHAFYTSILAAPADNGCTGPMPEMSMRKLFRNLLGKQQADETSESGIDTLQETLLRLQQLVETRTFVDVKFPLKSHHNFQSLILKVNPSERYLLIDELFPTSRALMVSSGDLVEITSRSRGMPVKFKTTVQSVGIDDVDGMPAYRLALPGAVQA